MNSSKSISIPAREEALSGRSQALTLENRHFVNGHPIQPPFPTHLNTALFGLGCFWGAERKFWEHQGVYSTAVGYSAGFTPNPTYQEVCSGMTGHNEVVLVIFDPSKVDYLQLLIGFWEYHNPTQGMRQGNDIGSQYRSGIYCFNEQQLSIAQNSLQQFQKCLTKNNFGEISTEIRFATEFYYAEEYHQQYLAKTPGGYCGLGGTGVSYTQQ